MSKNNKEDVSFGEINAILNILGGKDGVEKLLKNEWTIDRGGYGSNLFKVWTTVQTEDGRNVNLVRVTCWDFDYKGNLSGLMSRAFKAGLKMCDKKTVDALHKKYVESKVENLDDVCVAVEMPYPVKFSIVKNKESMLLSEHYYELKEHNFPFRNTSPEGYSWVFEI